MHLRIESLRILKSIKLLYIMSIYSMSVYSDFVGINANVVYFNLST